MGTGTKAVGTTLSPVVSQTKPRREGTIRVTCGHAQGRCPGHLGDLTPQQVADPHRRRWHCPVCGRRNDIPSPP